MSSFPWLTALIAAPVVGSLFVWLVRGSVRAYARQIAFGIAVVVFVGAVVMAFNFDTSAGEYQFSQTVSWIPQFGVSYAVGINGIGLTMILLATLLVPLVLLAAWKEEKDPTRQANYAALVLMLEAFMVVVFAARDLFLFYVVFEAMLIPVYFLIGSFGGKRRKKAAVKFLLYSLFGGLVMLVGLIVLYAHVSPKGAGSNVFMIDNLVGHGLGMTPTMERLVFLSFFAAFAIKAPMFPVHTWLPDAAQEARPGTSVLLVGVLDKVGTFGMMALCLPLFPSAAQWARPVIIVLAVVSILYGAILALGQKDIMRMVAYTSVSHFGFIVLGIFVGDNTAYVGSAFYMVNHGLSTGALFLLAGYLVRRTGTQDMTKMGPGLQRITPMLAGLFLTVGLSALALPGLSPFISEFMVLVGSFQANKAAAIVAALGVVLAALYILMTYQKIFTGTASEERRDYHDLSGREIWAIAPLIAIMLFLGFYPKPALDPLTAAALPIGSLSHAEDIGSGTDSPDLSNLVPDPEKGEN